MSIKFKAKKSLIWTSINQFGIQIINFIVLLVLTRLLSPKEIGLIALISILVGVGNMLINGGLSQSLLRTSNPTEEDYSAVFYSNLVLGVIIYSLVYILAPFIAIFYKSQILALIIRVYCITFVFNSISNVQIAKLTIDLNFKIQAYIILPGTILSGLLGIFIAFKNFGVWSLVWPQVFLSFYTAVVFFIWTKWMPKFNFKLNLIKSHWKFSYKLMLAGLLDAIFINLYSPLVGKKFGIYQAGFYYRADSIKQFPLSNLSTILNRVVYPLLTPYQDNEVLIKRLVSKILKMVVFFLFPLIILLTIQAEPIFRFLFTEKWLGSVKLYQIMCGIALIYPIHIINLSVLNIKGYSNKFFKIQIIKTILSTLTVLVFMRWGIFWLIIGLNIENLIAFLINTYYTNKIIQYGAFEQIKDVFPIFITSIISGLICAIIDNLLVQYHMNDLIRIIVSIITMLIIYLTLVHIFMKSLKYEVINFFLYKQLK